MTKKILSINGQFLAVNDSLIAMPDINLQDKTVTPQQNAQVVVADTEFTGLNKVTVEGDVNLIPENIAKDAVIFGVVGTHEGGPDVSNVTATESDVLAPKVFIDNEGIEKVGTIPTQEAQVIVPSTSDIILSSGLYLGGPQTIKGDSNLIADNIKKGVSIFNIAGSYEQQTFAFITVTYPAGSTCTCTDGTTTLTANTTTGSYVFCVPYAGIWTVTATDGANTASKNATISTKAQSVSVELVYDLIIFANGKYQSDITMSNTSISGSQLVFTHSSSESSAKVSSSSKIIDVTKYSKLVIKGTYTNGDTSSNYVYRIWSAGLAANVVSSKQYNTGEYAVRTGATGVKSSNINAALDITSLNGNYYICMSMDTYSGTFYMRISEMRLAV